MNDILRMAFEAVTQHMPASAAWMQYAGVASLMAFGLILLAKGAKLAPIMAACAFLGMGGVAGSFLANWLGTPPWPTIAITGLAGFVLGLVLFKVWLAVLVGGCFVTAGLVLYTAQVVSPHIQNYASQGYDAQESAVGVRLPAPGSIVTAAPSTPAEFEQLWSYLKVQVPNFEASFLAIIASMGLAGVLVGLLLPRASRAVFAATAGTLCIGLGLTAAVEAVSPGISKRIWSTGYWPALAVGLVWALSLLRNYMDIRRKRLQRREPEEEKAEEGVVVSA